MQFVSPLDAMPAILPGFLKLVIQLGFAKDKRIFTCTSSTGAKPTLRFKVNKAINNTTDQQGSRATTTKESRLSFFYVFFFLGIDCLHSSYFAR